MANTDTSALDCVNDGGVPRAAEVALEAALRLYQSGIGKFPDASFLGAGPFQHFIPLVESIYGWVVSKEPQTTITNG